MKAQILRWKFVIGGLVLFLVLGFFVHRYFTDVECPPGWDLVVNGERVIGCSFPDIEFVN